MQQPPQNDPWNTWGNNQQSFPQPDWSDPNQPTFMAPAFPGQFQSQIPPPPPPPKKRNRGCLIGGIVGGVLAFFLLLCVIVASFAPPVPQASTSNVGTLVTATSAPTPTPTTAPTQAALPTQGPTPTQAPTSTPVPTPTPTVQAFVAPTATPIPTTVPTTAPEPTPIPTKAPTPKPTPTPVPAKVGVNNNPWGYDFNPGSAITNPPAEFCNYFPCIGNFWNGNGYVIQCKDGMYSKSGGRQGSCSQHGGNGRQLYAH